MTIPEGFAPHFRKSPLTDPWEPLYSRRSDNGIIIGLFADEQHCNSRGFVHGGLISALSDNALGLSCASHYDRDKLGGLVTISLHVDFTSSVKKGDWMECVTHGVCTGRNIATAQGQVIVNGKTCAMIGATFKVLTKS
ncbi:PaaI family thioesterase [Hellea balneolensis]|uniref:PaaI family thioesterase n=1 Tax=Hellea balneolensis TaxID=287478 RepID=UPI00041B72CA|nr:PaaI family thioesterase [Hellea balneolensis]